MTDPERAAEEPSDFSRIKEVKRLIPDYPRVVFIALVIVVGAALIFAASTSTVAFGTYNPSWDGTSNLRSEAVDTGLEPEIIRNTTSYATTQSEGTLTIILSPQTDYGPTETERIASFVRNGGTLLVAGGMGTHSNDLLASVGANARFDGRTLRDDRYHYRSSALPIATNVSSHRFTAGVERLTLNYGTAIHPNNSTVLVSSSEYAYLDTNGNGKIDPDESLGTRAIVTVERIGDGHVIAVSDPSVFINTMLDQADNRAFVHALLRNHERLMLDFSHTGELPSLVVALLVLRETPLLQFILGCLGVAAVGVAIRRPELFSRILNRWSTQEHAIPGADSEELAAVVRKRHPDWDDERVQRVIQAIITHREEASVDERSR